MYIRTQVHDIYACMHTFVRTYIRIRKHANAYSCNYLLTQAHTYTQMHSHTRQGLAFILLVAYMNSREIIHPFVQPSSHTSVYIVLVHDCTVEASTVAYIVVPSS